MYSVIGPTLFDCMVYMAGLHLLAFVTVLLASSRKHRLDNIATLHVWMMALWFALTASGIAAAVFWRIYDGATVVAFIMLVASGVEALGLHKLIKKYGTPASRQR